MLSAYGAVISFILAWLIRLQALANRSNKEIAVNTQADKARDVELINLRVQLKSIDRKMDTVIKCVTEQKQMYNDLHQTINETLNRSA